VILGQISIGKVVKKVDTWNPARSGTNQAFEYIDLSAVDRASKEIVATTPTLPAEAPSRARQLVAAGDVLVSTVRPNLNGVAAVPGLLDGATASTGFTVLRPEPTLLDPRYLFHWVRTPAFVRDMTRKATGASYPAVSDAIVKDSGIPLPPLPEQRRIAAILDKADAIRRKRRQAIELTEELLRSAFRARYCAGDEWPTRALGEICSKITDGAHRTPTYVGEGVPFLRITDIKSGFIDWRRVKAISEAEHLELTKRCRPEPGDVLYSKNGTIGIPRLVDWEWDFSIFVSLALLKPRAELLEGGFLESFLQTEEALRQATAHSKTLTVTNLHLVEIRKVTMPLPPLHEQRNWLAVRREMDAIQSRQRRAAQEADNLFHSLAQRAFRGEL